MAEKNLNNIDATDLDQLCQVVEVVEDLEMAGRFMEPSKPPPFLACGMDPVDVANPGQAVSLEASPIAQVIKEHLPELPDIQNDLKTAFSNSPSSLLTPELKA